jgi:dihydropteroate synthase-like protein
LRILVLTGKIAFPIVRSIAEDISKRIGVSIDVDVLSVPVAALMTVKDVLEHLSRKPEEARVYDMIITPGLLVGDLDIVNRTLGVRCYKGSRYIGDLPAVVEEVVRRGANLSTTKPADVLLGISKRADYGRLIQNLEEGFLRAFKVGSIEIPLQPPPFRIFAEVNIEEPIELVVKEARRLVNDGANIIILGTHADSNNPDLVKRAFRYVGKVINAPLGIDSINPREVEAAVNEGAVLVMNISRSFFHFVEELGRDLVYVLVPEHVEDQTAISRVRALERDLEDLRSLGVEKIILDPVIPPPHFGAIEGIYAVSLTRRTIAGYPVLMSSANIVEMIDADSIGANALIASLALEAGASIILTTEDSWKTRGSVREVKRACLMCSVAYVRKSPPKDLGIDLLIAKSKEKPMRIPIAFEEDIMVDRYIPPSRLDRERFFVIQPDYDSGYIEVYIFSGNDKEKALYRVRGRDPRSIGRVALRLLGVQDPEHSLYLGIELSRAHEALRTGKRYEQDESLGL